MIDKLIEKQNRISLDGYYIVLAVAVAFWLIIGASVLSNVENVLAQSQPSDTSSSSTVCGINVSSAQEEYNENTGRYEINFTLRNTTDKRQTLNNSRMSCRCEEPNGQNSEELGYDFDWQVCVGDWPNSLSNPSDPSDHESNCRFNDSDLVLDPGQSVERTVSVTTTSDAVDPNCGSFQADWHINSVTDSEGNVCDPDNDPDANTHEGKVLPVAYGVLFTGRETDGRVCRLQSELEDPICDLSATPTNGEAPLTVDFDGRGSSDADGSITRYDWLLGDGESSSESNFSHTYDEPGTYDVSLTVEDNDGLSSNVCREEVTVTKSKIQSPVCDISYSPSSGEAPLTVNFDGRGSSDLDGEIVRYDWILGDGATTTESNFTHTYEEPGTYDVLMTVEDDDGLSSEICEEQVEVLKKEIHSPVCEIETIPAPPEGDAPLTVEFDGRSSTDQDGEIVRYDWLLGDGATTTESNFTHTYTEPGSYTVRMSVEDDDGLSSEICSLVVRAGEEEDEEGPQFSVPPWVKHVAGEENMYRKTIKIVSGGSVSSWSVSGASIVTQSSSSLTIEAETGSCPTFQAQISGTTYGPFNTGCVPN